MLVLRSSKSEKVHTSTASLDTDGDSGIDVAGVAPHAQPVRHSGAEYLTSFSGYLNPFPSKISSITLRPNSPPPSYDDTQDRPSLRNERIPVCPREEEGREQLPEYYCSIHKEGVFYTKMELSSPFDRATDRSWNKEYVVLHGTVLKMHKPKRIPFFATPDMRSGVGEDGSIRPNGWLPGELTKSYTLQGAEVGIATDYKKRHFVIRIRAETEQFLLSLKSVDEFIAWLEALSAAVDLSPALEERTLPRYRTIPRRRRREGREVIEEQERIIRLQFPHLAEGEGITEEEDEEGGRRNSSSTTDGDEVMRPQHRRGVRGRRNTQVSSTGQDFHEVGLGYLRSAAPAQPQSQIEPSPYSTSSTANRTTSGTASASSSSPSSTPRLQMRGPPSIPHSIHNSHSGASGEGPDGKWRPPNTLTPEANLRYARRCMAILCEDSPRQSEYVIKDGKRYRLVWAKKELVPEVYDEDSEHQSLKTAPLPNYEDIMQSMAATTVEPRMTTSAVISRRLTARTTPIEPRVGPSRAGSRLRNVAAGGRIGLEV